MKKYRLNNGLMLIYEKKPTKAAAIEILVKTGSNYESKKQFGISHFIEHMVFKGTKKRSSKKISEEIFLKASIPSQPFGWGWPAVWV